jgi:hypothetical protein
MMQQMLNNPRPGMCLGEGDYAQVLFLSSNPKIPSTQQTSQMVGNVLYQPNMRQAIAGGEYADNLKKLVVAWFERHVEESPNVIYPISSLLMQTSIKEVVEPVLKLATNKDAVLNIRATALLIVGRIGSKEHLAQIEPLIADTSALGTFIVNQKIIVRGAGGGPPGGGNIANNQVQTTVQLGDVAQAVAIHLHGQKPSDFGYSSVQTGASYLNSYLYLGFTEDAARADSRRKWKEWLDKNKDEKK